MKIPNFNDIQFVDKNGMLTDQWKQILTQLFTELQKNVSNEGFIIPQQTSAHIATLSTDKSIGAIVFDSDTNQFKACVKSGITGVFKVINLL